MANLQTYEEVERKAAIKAERDAKAQKEKEESRQKAKELVDFAKLERSKNILRPFALREMPEAWYLVQELGVLFKEQEKQIVKYAEDLQLLGRNPAKDSGYRRLCERRLQIANELNALISGLEELYLHMQASRSVPGGDSETRRLRQALNKQIQQGKEILQ